MTASAGVFKNYAAGVELLKRFEGCELKAYQCAAGIWTIGWGNTTHLDGKAVKAGDEISKRAADQMLQRTLDSKVLPALGNIPYWNEMTAEQQGALISFAWNLGWNFYEAKGFETISRRLRERDWHKVPEAFLLYRNPGSSFESGLRRRREAEGKLWLQGMAALEEPAKPVVKATPKPILYRIEAVQATWLKKERVQASELGEKEKVFCGPGKDYAVVAYDECPADGHARVELAAGAGTWFLFEPHWRKVTGGAPGMATEVDWSDFSCLVTPSLSVGEILQYDKRRIPGPSASIRSRLLRTAAEFQRVREAWGRPLGVTSFYRPEPVNRQMGGVPGSRHVTGEAFDIYPVDRSLESFYQWIRRRWTGGLGDGRPRGFVHLDCRNGGGFVPGAGARPAAEWNY